MDRPVRRTRRPRRSYIPIAIAVFMGAVLGGILGQLLKNALPFMARYYPIGLKPSTVDLSVFTLTVGFDFRISVAAVLGAVAAAYMVSRR